MVVVVVVSAHTCAVGSYSDTHGEYSLSSTQKYWLCVRPCCRLIDESSEDGRREMGALIGLWVACSLLLLLLCPLCLGVVGLSGERQLLHSVRKVLYSTGKVSVAISQTV